MKHPLPIPFLRSLRSAKGFDEDAFVRVHESGEQVTSIRYNPLKLSSTVSHQLNYHQPPTTNHQPSPIPWCPHGFYLAERPSFTFDPLFHAGMYYVQEASSMFLWHMLQQIIGARTEGLRVLDLCAAPGGKSTLLASYFTDGFVVANEVIRSRASVLVENIIKWGCDNVVVTNNDPSDFKQLENYFDLIVVDAPCSGSGLFRKNPSAIDEWSEDNVRLCSLRQQRILADPLPALKKNGILIYSTCSYSLQEDEEILDHLMSSYKLSPINCQPLAEWGIIETESPQHKAIGHRFYPDKIKGEGFFIAAFRKDDGDEFVGRKPNIPSASKEEIALARTWLKDDKPLSFIKQKENILAVPEAFLNDVALLQKHLYLRKAGITIGAQKGKSIVPHHELALSLLLNDAIEKVPLTKEQAILYLQKKDLQIGAPVKGWALSTCNNAALGWMKILPNRVNNYYPVEWRILKH